MLLLRTENQFCTCRMLRPSYFIAVFIALIIFGAGMPASLPDIGLVPAQQHLTLSASVSHSGDSVYAEQPAATLLDDVSQMFNERGYLKSNGIPPLLVLARNEAPESSL